MRESFSAKVTVIDRTLCRARGFASGGRCSRPLPEHPDRVRPRARVKARLPVTPPAELSVESERRLVCLERPQRHLGEAAGRGPAPGLIDQSGAYPVAPEGGIDVDGDQLRDV